jgi:hypothetical protein
MSGREKASFCDVPTLNVLVSNLEEQVERGIRSRLLIPDWSSFKSVVKNSEHNLKEKDERYAGYMISPAEVSVSFELTQSLVGSMYEEGSPTLGFGFCNFECLECGEDELLYDEEKEVRYCPKHG